MADTASSRLARHGVELPAAPDPVGSYVAAIRTGDCIRTTGQLPFVDGRLVATGTVGVDVDLETAQVAARVAVVNALAAAAELAGGVDRITRVVALVVHIACERGFVDHPVVADAASNLLVVAFGDAGRHVRTNVGSPALPLGSPVEVELTVECRG